MKFHTSNDLLSAILIIIMFYLIIKENDIKIYPIMFGVGIITYSFTKDLKQTLLLSSLISYSLIVLLYKNYKKSVEKMTNSEDEILDEDDEDDEDERLGDIDSESDDDISSEDESADTTIVIDKKNIDKMQKELLKKLNNIKPVIIPILKQGQSLLKFLNKI